MRSFIYLIIVSLLFSSYSSSQESEKIGVLVLAHGGSPEWQEAVHQSLKPIQENYPVEIAFGMADPASIKQGCIVLQQKSVTKVIVVPLFISSYSPIIRQTEYLLHLRKELADEPMMDHNHSQMSLGSDKHSQAEETQNHSQHNNIEEMELQPLDITKNVVMTKALDDHPLIAEILYVRVMELSHQPENETIVLVAHGPNDESDNKHWVQTMESLSDQIRTLFTQRGAKKFKNILCVTVRDDADTEIYEQAKEHLRNIVRQAGKDGKVLVIPLFLSQGGVEKKVATRLEGLEYEWSGKTLLPHLNITRFIELSVTEGLKK